MKPLTQVYLFGSLRKGSGDRCSCPLPLDLEAPTSLDEVLRRLQIPSYMVQMAMVNFRAVPRNYTIHPGDRLSLFPKEYALFADWMDLRF